METRSGAIDRRVPRSIVSIGVDPALRASLPTLAAGRALVIDSFRSRSCGVWIGDLTLEWRSIEPGPEFAELHPLDGVRLFANRRLLRLLRDGGPLVRRGRVPLVGGLALDLERPELWIDFLDDPTSFGLLEG